LKLQKEAVSKKYLPIFFWWAVERRPYIQRLGLKVIVADNLTFRG